MAICIRGMDREETRILTGCMAASGGRLERGAPGPPRLDKHSTGGVGDKVSLVLAPLLAARGVQVPMLSGRGLLHTGGTLDKLEAIPGLCTDLDRAGMARCLAGAGCFIAGASADLAPADRRLYAIRDVTETVDSIPLITASILAKKLAAGLDGLVLDIKVGRGAFMGERERARELACSLVETAAALGLPATALLTAMDSPLGGAVGNALEVAEAVAVLAGEGPVELVSLVLDLGAELLLLGGVEKEFSLARKSLAATLADGSARERFGAMVSAQGGDPRVVEEPDRLPRAPVVLPLESPGTGRLTGLDALEIGRAAMALGAGRRRRGEEIDPACGFRFLRRVGEAVRAGETIGEVHAPGRVAAEQARERVLAALALDGGEAPRPGTVLETLRGEEHAG